MCVVFKCIIAKVIWYANMDKSLNRPTVQRSRGRRVPKQKSVIEAALDGSHMKVLKLSNVIQSHFFIHTKLHESRITALISCNNLSINWFHKQIKQQLFSVIIQYCSSSKKVKDNMILSARILRFSWSWHYRKFNSFFVLWTVGETEHFWSCLPELWETRMNLFWGVFFPTVFSCCSHLKIAWEARL